MIFVVWLRFLFDAFFILSLLYGETRVSRIFSRKSLRFHGLTTPTVVEGGVEHEAHEDLSTNRLTDSNDIRAFLRIWMKEPKVVLAAFDHNRKSKHIPSLPETKSEFTPENGRPYSLIVTIHMHVTINNDFIQIPWLRGCYHSIC